MINGYTEGSDLTIMDARYSYPKKDEETGKWSKGSMTLIAKDNVTGKKVLQVIENPTYDFYFLKDSEEVVEYNQLFIEVDKVDKFTVPYIDLEKKIAELTGNLEFFYDNISNNDRKNNKKLHTHNKVFFSDSHIEDHYRFKFGQIYTNNICSVTKSYMDIEADTIKMKGDFPKPGECPINAITIICGVTNRVFTLLLRNSNNPLIQEFEDSLDTQFFIDLKDFIKENVGGWKEEIRFGLDKLDYQIYFYDEEIDLIKDLFNIINRFQPDFVLAWNMAFDIPYIIQRIVNLGYCPAEIMCHPDFENKVAKYFIDERVANVYAERGDFANISSYSIFLDQMIQFASRRKGQAQFSSYGLDNIGTVIAKVRKLSYKHITTDITQLPYLDYKVFVMYNIFDTIVQKCIEAKVGDIDYVFGKAVNNNTRYSKIHRQTVYLKNRGIKEFFKDGYIMGNNVNVNSVKTGKFPGAFVADPTKVSDYSKIKINGIPVNMFDNADDFDYARLYPSMLQEFNMAPNTQIGCVVIKEQIHDLENRTNDDKFTRGGTFLEDLASRNYLEFCHRWMKLADYSALYDDVIDYFTNVRDPYRIINKVENGMFNPIMKHRFSEYREPIRREKGEYRNVITKHITLNEDLKGDILNVFDNK